MFLPNSSTTPSDPEVTKGRLLQVFRESANGDLFTLDDIADRLDTPRRDTIAYLLGELAARHIIDQFVTILSPASHGGIVRYTDLNDVPDEIFDPFQMKDIEVEPSLIRVYFTKHIDGGLPALTTGAGDER